MYISINMNVISLLLIVGLIYISVQQKKDSTRNMMLLMTGLLAFCMLGKKVEGYCTIPLESIVSDNTYCLGDNKFNNDPTRTGTYTVQTNPGEGHSARCELQVDRYDHEDLDHSVLDSLTNGLQFQDYWRNHFGVQGERGRWTASNGRLLPDPDTVLDDHTELTGFKSPTNHSGLQVFSQLIDPQGGGNPICSEGEIIKDWNDWSEDAKSLCVIKDPNDAVRPDGNIHVHSIGPVDGNIIIGTPGSALSGDNICTPAGPGSTGSGSAGSCTTTPVPECDLHHVAQASCIQAGSCTWRDMSCAVTNQDDVCGEATSRGDCEVAGASENDCTWSPGHASGSGTQDGTSDFNDGVQACIDGDVPGCTRTSCLEPDRIGCPDGHILKSADRLPTVRPFTDAACCEPASPPQQDFSCGSDGAETALMIRDENTCKLNNCRVWLADNANATQCNPPRATVSDSEAVSILNPSLDTCCPVETPQSINNLTDYTKCGLSEGDAFYDNHEDNVWCVARSWQEQPELPAGTSWQSGDASDPTPTSDWENENIISCSNTIESDLLSVMAYYCTMPTTPP